VTCDACGTAFHAQCDAEFGSGCPTSGCSATVPKAERRRPTIPPMNRTQPQAEPPPGVGSEIGSLLLLALGLLGALASVAILVVESRVYHPAAKGALVVSILTVIGGFYINPNRERG